MKKRLVIINILVVAVSFLQAELRYRVTDLTESGEDSIIIPSIGCSINDNGDITGIGIPVVNSKPFKYDAASGEFINLGNLNGNFTDGKGGNSYGMNNLGQIVGRNSNADKKYEYLPFVFIDSNNNYVVDPGEMDSVAIADIYDNGGWAYDNNDTGRIVGKVTIDAKTVNDEDRDYGFVSVDKNGDGIYSLGEIQYFDEDYIPIKINNSGVICLNHSTDTYIWKDTDNDGVYDPNDGLQLIPVPSKYNYGALQVGIDFMSLKCIDENGSVCGAVENQFGVGNGFYWSDVDSDGIIEESEYLYFGTPLKEIHVRAMNDNGQVVGGTYDFSKLRRAFIWSAADGELDLNTISDITAGDLGLPRLSQAEGINNSGQIVVTARYDINGDGKDNFGEPEHVLVLSPYTDGGATRYSVIDLTEVAAAHGAEILPDTAYCLNENGDVAGHGYPNIQITPKIFKYDANRSELVNLGNLAVNFTDGYGGESADINSQGIIVGYSSISNESPEYRPFLFKDKNFNGYADSGEMINLVLSSDFNYGQAMAVNDSGVAVGFSEGTDETDRGWVILDSDGDGDYEESELQVIGEEYYPVSINNYGDILLYKDANVYILSDVNEDGFYNAADIVSLSLPTSYYDEQVAENVDIAEMMPKLISDSNKICGEAKNVDGKSVGYFASDLNGDDIISANEYVFYDTSFSGVYPVDMNGDSLVVGGALDPNSVAVAFAWSPDDGMMDLNIMADSYSGSYPRIFTRAESVNNWGVILVSGYYDENENGVRDTVADEDNDIEDEIVFILEPYYANFSGTPEYMYKLMTPAHASGTGLSTVIGSSVTGAYAIKTNGMEYNPEVGFDPANGFDPNDGVYEFWSINFGANQSVRKFTMGVDGSKWLDHFDGYDYTTYYGQYGSYVDPEVTAASIDNLYGTSIVYAYESVLGRVATGAPDFSTGDCSVYRGGSLRAGSFVLNPVALTFKGVTYQPGELALVTSIDGCEDPKYRKVVLFYDLRQVGEKTNRQPDYDTGEDGIGNNTPQFGAFGQTDWNDAFYPLVTGQKILDSVPGLSSAKTFNFGRQAVWAPDGSAIYFAGFIVNPSYNENDPSSVNYYNGIWKYDLINDKLVQIRRNNTREERMYYCEMAAMDTGLRDFTDGQESGIQVMFCSEFDTGNEGGISCIVDDGSVDPNELANQSVYTVLSADKLSEMNGQAPEVNYVKNIIATADGEIYFYCTGNSAYLGSDYVNSGGSLYRGSFAIYRYDTRDRLYAISNRATHMTFNVGNGSSISGSTGAMGAMQYYDDLFAKKMLAFRNTSLAVPCGIEIFSPLDFNHDGRVNVSDLRIFRDERIQSEKYRHPMEGGAGEEQMPGIFEISLDHINCDIDGNAMYQSYVKDQRTGEILSDEVLEQMLNGTYPEDPNFIVVTDKRIFNDKIVTESDARVLYQFISAGDANLDGTVDMEDFARLAANHESGNSLDNKKDFSQGDFDFDGDVDLNDLQLMIVNWLDKLSLVEGQEPIYRQ